MATGPGNPSAGGSPAETSRARIDFENLSDKERTAVEELCKDLKNTEAQSSAAFELPRATWSVNVEQLRNWFWDQRPIAIVSKAIQLRHSKTRETAQVTGFVEDFPLPLPCGHEGDKDILTTTHFWLAACKKCNAIHWVDKNEIDLTEAIARAAADSMPYEVHKAEHSNVPLYLETMKQRGRTLVEKLVGEGIFTHLIYIKSGHERRVPSNKVLEVS